MRIRPILPWLPCISLQSTRRQVLEEFSSRRLHPTWCLHRISQKERISESRTYLDLSWLLFHLFSLYEGTHWVIFSGQMDLERDVLRKLRLKGVFRLYQWKGLHSLQCSLWGRFWTKWTYQWWRLTDLKFLFYLSEMSSCLVDSLFLTVYHSPHSCCDGWRFGWAGAASQSVLSCAS